MNPKYRSVAVKVIYKRVGSPKIGSSTTNVTDGHMMHLHTWTQYNFMDIQWVEGPQEGPIVTNVTAGHGARTYRHQ